MSTAKKRKPLGTHQPTYRSRPSSSLFIEAHEADIVSSSAALRNAQSLEVEVLPSGSKHIGDALIRWSLSEDVQRTASGESTTKDTNGVWLDRYAPHEHDHYIVTMLPNTRTVIE